MTMFADPFATRQSITDRLAVTDELLTRAEHVAASTTREATVIRSLADDISTALSQLDAVIRAAKEPAA